MGFQLLLLMFAGVTLGGLGTAYGALVGSLVVGVVVQVSTLWIPRSSRTSSPCSILILDPAGATTGHPRPGRAGRIGAAPWTGSHHRQLAVGGRRPRRDHLRPRRHRPQHALRLHRPAQLRPGRLHGRRRLRRRHQRPRLGCPLWVGVLVGILAAVGCWPCCSAYPTLRLRADYLAIVTIAAGEIFRFVVMAPLVPRRHGRRPTASPASPATSTTSTRSPSGQLRLRLLQVQRRRRLWVLLVGWALVLLAVLLVWLLDAQPVGPGAQGDPRGRGRRPGAGQERVTATRCRA